MSDLNVDKSTPSPESYSTKGTGDAELDSLLGVGTVRTTGIIKQQDTIQAGLKNKESVIMECDQPHIETPNEELVTNQNLFNAIQEIKSNPWFAKAFLAVFLDIMNDLLNQQREIHLKEAEIEMDARVRLFELAKASGALAKALMQNQAQEQMLQAISSFATAGMSATQFIQSTRNFGAAKREIEQETADKKIEVEKLELQKRNIVVAGQDPQAIAQALAADRQVNPDSKWPDLVDAKKELKDMEKDQHGMIQRRMEQKDRSVQYLGEAQKQTINGVTAVLTSMIKVDSSTKEEMQKLIEGFIQALNKFSETSTKARDDAANNFSRFVDFLNKIVDSVFKAHSLSGRG